MVFFFLKMEIFSCFKLHNFISNLTREAKEKQKNEETNTECIVEPMTNGPLMVYGNIKVKDNDGNEINKNKLTAFCRCGASQNKPYCDGTHTKIDFLG